MSGLELDRQAVAPATLLVRSARLLDPRARLNGRAERVFQKGAYNRTELIGIVHGIIARRIAGGPPWQNPVEDAA